MGEASASPSGVSAVSAAGVRRADPVGKVTVTPTLGGDWSPRSTTTPRVSGLSPSMMRVVSGSAESTPAAGCAAPGSGAAAAAATSQAVNGASRQDMTRPLSGIRD
jgi:hypothetical protein